MLDYILTVGDSNGCSYCNCIPSLTDDFYDMMSWLIYLLNTLYMQVQTSAPVNELTCQAVSHVEMRFEISNYLLSRLKIRSLRVMDKGTDHSNLVRARYLTYSDSYVGILH